MPNRIMAHLVAHYPDEESSLEIARGLADGGAAYLEVQFPFSDPTADGPVIQAACARALAQGFTVSAGFALITRISRATSLPVFVMSYANMVFRAGIGEFVRRCRDAGAKGIIVPDLSPGADEGLYAEGARTGIAAVPVIVPTMSSRRLEAVRAVNPEFLYAALRTGITGASTTSLGVVRSRNGAKNPMALDPPPTQATRASTSMPASLTCSSTSRPITDWNSLAMSGYGEGPRAEPRR